MSCKCINAPRIKLDSTTFYCNYSCVFVSLPASDVYTTNTFFVWSLQNRSVTLDGKKMYFKVFPKILSWIYCMAVLLTHENKQFHIVYFIFIYFLYIYVLYLAPYTFRSTPHLLCICLIISFPHYDATTAMFHRMDAVL